jgi:hypothetical protein
MPDRQLQRIHYGFLPGDLAHHRDDHFDLPNHLTDSI